MCGLFAYTGTNGSEGREEHHRNLIRDMMIEAGRRGPHAWGVACVGNGGIVSHRLQEMEPLEVVAPSLAGAPWVKDAFIGHARLATGQALRRGDTQPLVSADRRFAVAHNGTIKNPQRIYDCYGYSPRTTNDSEAILCVLQHEGLRRGIESIYRDAENVNVPMAIIAYSAGEGFAAFRCYHPLYIKPVEEGYYLCSRLVGVNVTFQPLPEGEIFLCRI